MTGSRSGARSPARPARPVLVTGMPRSGTTWLARLVATAPGTALTGREPMNPGPRQYRLAGTVDGWCELDEPSPRQRRALRRAYRAWTPQVFSRYGRRQWAAPLTRTRVVVKDPFAMLSLPTVAAVTGAVPVLLFRHPGAALVSYRRMGWSPDLDEVRAVVARHAWAQPAVGGAAVPRPGEVGDAEAMGRFWSALYAIALDNLARTPGALVVSHEELASNGEPAARVLFDALGVSWAAASETEFRIEAPTATPVDGTALHQFHRDPAQAATQWHDRLDPDDAAVITAVSAPVLQRLDDLRLPLA